MQIIFNPLGAVIGWTWLIQHRLHFFARKIFRRVNAMVNLSSHDQVEGRLIDGIPLPRHIAIIMDGNGRWAKKHHLPRFRGHMEGVNRVEEIAMFANEIGIKYLTLFTFSTENWNRPASEITMLMKTVCNILEQRMQKLLRVNIKVTFIGQREGLPQDVLDSIDKAVELTKDNTGLVLCLAFNYGGRTEIIDAVKKIAREVQAGNLEPKEITPQVFSSFLYTAGVPDPDLLIRTSGEQRISNFLLWQLSYAEMYFSQALWPDFGEVEFRQALLDFQKRDRRFGKVAAVETPASV